MKRWVKMEGNPKCDVCFKENIAITGVLEVLDTTLLVKNDEGVGIHPVFKMRFDLHDGKCVADFGLVLGGFLVKSRNVLGKSGDVLWVFGNFLGVFGVFFLVNPYTVEYKSLLLLNTRTKEVWQKLLIAEKKHWDFAKNQIKESKQLKLCFCVLFICLCLV